MNGKHSIQIQDLSHPSTPARAHPPNTAQRRASALSRGLRGACITLIVLLSSTAFSLAMAVTSPNIQLTVHNYASNGSDGFTNTTASNGATYSYRYSGGQGNGGDVIFRSRGKVTVNVSLSDASDYAVDNVSFTGDVHNQLSWLTSNSTSSTAVIQDQNDQLQSAEYKVTVRTNSGITVPCDPKIVNQ